MYDWKCLFNFEHPLAHSTKLLSFNVSWHFCVFERLQWFGSIVSSLILMEYHNFTKRKCEDAWLFFVRNSEKSSIDTKESNVADDNQPIAASGINKIEIHIAHAADAVILCSRVFLLVLNIHHLCKQRQYHRQHVRARLWVCECGHNEKSLFEATKKNLLRLYYILL